MKRPRFLHQKEVDIKLRHEMRNVRANSFRGGRARCGG